MGWSTHLETEKQKNTRLTPRRGRPREDVKQVKIPETAYRMLYEFAKEHNLTFGDAAAQLVKDSMLKMMDAPGDPAGWKPLEGVRRQVKVSKKTHTALYLLAKQRQMTIGDAAALLIGVSLMERYHLDEDASARDQRVKRERRLKDLGGTLARIELTEHRKRKGV